MDIVILLNIPWIGVPFFGILVQCGWRWLSTDFFFQDVFFELSPAEFFLENNYTIHALWPVVFIFLYTKTLILFESWLFCFYLKNVGIWFSFIINRMSSSTTLYQDSKKVTPIYGHTIGPSPIHVPLSLLTDSDTMLYVFWKEDGWIYLWL